MEVTSEVWDKIYDVIDSEKPEQFVELVGDILSDERWDDRSRFYAAGYLSYRNPERNIEDVRDLFRRSLLAGDGYMPSVLHLAFLQMDVGDYLSALELLLSCDESGFETEITDWYFEAKICCLIRCGYWIEADRELGWFRTRRKRDPLAGFCLINFNMIFAEEMVAEDSVQRRVLDYIGEIVNPRI